MLWLAQTIQISPLSFMMNCWKFQIQKELKKMKCALDILKKIATEKQNFTSQNLLTKKKATVGNGSQISFQTSSRELVDKFHDVGIKLGGASEGSGGERPEGSGVYYSYIRDLDGNKICAFTNNQ